MYTIEPELLIERKEMELFRKICQLLITLVFYFIGLKGYGQVEQLIKKLPYLKGKEKIQALADISYFYSSVDVDKGISYGKKAFEEASHLKDSELQAQVLSDWSISYYNKGLYDSVLYLMTKAMPLAQKSGNEILVAKVYNKQALAHFEKGQFNKALEENLLALKIFNSIEALPQVTQININIGAIYEKTKHFKEAERYYLKALEAAKVINNPSILVSLYGNLGVLYMKMTQYQKANEMYFLCLKYIDEGKDLHFMCTIYQNIGVNFRNQGRIKEGLSYYLKAITIAEKLKSKSAMTPLLSNIGQCYLDLKDFNQGETYLTKSLILAKEINSYIELRNAYKGLTRLEHLRGNYEKADQYFDSYIEYQDSIYSEKNNRIFNELSVKYKTATKENALLEEQLISSHFKTWVWILCLLFVVVLLVALSLQLKRTSEKRRLEIQNLKDLEFERMRISRDLHDNIGAELTLITSKLDIIASHAIKQEEEKELNELAELSRGASNLLRETIWSIRQAAICKGDLLDKIEQFALKRSADRIKIQTVMQSDPLEEISSSNALHIFRIAQESLNNAIKYANANLINIKFGADYLEISDDGEGFDLETYKPGYGIQNIKQRTEEIGAEFILISTKKGTTIRIEGIF